MSDVALLAAPVASPSGRSVGVAVKLALAWLILLIGLALTADLLPLHDYVTAATTPNLRPNWGAEFLGTDSVGRSMLSRVIFGARVSLLIGICATALSMAVGMALGMFSAHFGGVVSSLVDVLANSVLAVPPLLFLLAVSIALRPGIVILVVLMSVIFVPAFMRLAYINALAETHKDYVVAAKLMGASSRHVVLREVLPNSVMPVLSYAVLVVPAIIVIEGSLSFLGYGVQAPRPSWGAMIAGGKTRLKVNPWEAMVPCIVLFITVFALNTVGDFARSRYSSRDRSD